MPAKRQRAGIPDAVGSQRYVTCPICSASVPHVIINAHLDQHVLVLAPAQQQPSSATPRTQSSCSPSQPCSLASFTRQAPASGALLVPPLAPTPVPTAAPTAAPRVSPPPLFPQPVDIPRMSPWHSGVSTLAAPGVSPGIAASPLARASGLSFAPVSAGPTSPQALTVFSSYMSRFPGRAEHGAYPGAGRLPTGDMATCDPRRLNTWHPRLRQDAASSAPCHRRLAERGRALRESVALAVQQHPGLGQQEAQLARLILSLPPLGAVLCAATLGEAGEWVRLDALPTADALMAEERAVVTWAGQSRSAGQTDSFANEAPGRLPLGSVAPDAAGGAGGGGDGLGVEICEEPLGGEFPAGASTDWDGWAARAEACRARTAIGVKGCDRPACEHGAAGTGATIGASPGGHGWVAGARMPSSAGPEHTAASGHAVGGQGGWAAVAAAAAPVVLELLTADRLAPHGSPRSAGQATQGLSGYGPHGGAASPTAGLPPAGIAASLPCRSAARGAGSHLPSHTARRTSLAQLARPLSRLPPRELRDVCARYGVPCPRRQQRSDARAHAEEVSEAVVAFLSRRHAPDLAHLLSAIGPCVRLAPGSIAPLRRLLIAGLAGAGYGPQTALCILRAYVPFPQPRAPGEAGGCAPIGGSAAHLSEGAAGREWQACGPVGEREACNHTTGESGRTPFGMCEDCKCGCIELRAALEHTEACVTLADTVDRMVAATTGAQQAAASASPSPHPPNSMWAPSTPRPQPGAAPEADLDVLPVLKELRYLLRDLGTDIQSGACGSAGAATLRHVAGSSLWHVLSVCASHLRKKHRRADGAALLAEAVVACGIPHASRAAAWLALAQQLQADGKKELALALCEEAHAVGGRLSGEALRRGMIPLGSVGVAGAAVAAGGEAGGRGVAKPPPAACGASQGGGVGACARDDGGCAASGGSCGGSGCVCRSHGGQHSRDSNSNAACGGGGGESGGPCRATKDESTTVVCPEGGVDRCGESAGGSAAGGWGAAIAGEVSSGGAAATGGCTGAEACGCANGADDGIVLGVAQLVAARRLLAKLAVPPRRWKKPRLPEPACAPEASAAPHAFACPPQAPSATPPPASARCRPLPRPAAAALAPYPGGMNSLSPRALCTTAARPHGENAVGGEGGTRLLGFVISQHG